MVQERLIAKDMAASSSRRCLLKTRLSEWIGFGVLSMQTCAFSRPDERGGRHMLFVGDMLFQVVHVFAAIRACGFEHLGIAIAGGHLATCPPAWQLKQVQERRLAPAAP
jgi:hypothetical protein